MLFNSVEFVVFLPICFFFYWFVLGEKTQAQNLFLRTSAYVFLSRIFFEEFDSQMEEMVVKQKVRYINLKDFNNKVETTDGNHLSRASAMEISKFLAKEIKSYHAN